MKTTAPNFSLRLKSFFVKKDKIISFLIHPLIISVPIAVLIIIILPPVFNKYTVNITQQKWKAESQYFYYADFNNDGISERIEFRQLMQNNYYLVVEMNNKIIDQWNFNGKIIWTAKPVISAYKSGGINVIYFFTLNNNKIYLNCLDPLNNRFITRDKFVVDYKPKHKEIDGTVEPVIFYDSNKDGIKEFYFSITVGYSIQPRGLFRFDPADTSIVRSEKFYAALATAFVADTAGNKLNIIYASQAVGNSDTSDHYSDMYSWFMGFNNNIKYLFTPIKIGFYPSASYLASINVNKQKYFVVFNTYAGTKNHQSTLYLFNSKFNVVKERKFNFTPQLGAAALYAPGAEPEYFYIIMPDGEMDKMNYELNIVGKIKIPTLRADNYFIADINGDNKNEVIFENQNPDQLIIAEDDFSYYTSAYCEGLGKINNYSVKLNGSGEPELDLVSDKREYLLTYHLNYLYYLKYAVYAAVFILVYLFMLLLQKTQRLRAESKYATEKKIAELQLRSINNQLEPHFTLNIINSIGSLYYGKDFEKADYIFGKFSKMLRATLLNSDKIITSLAEELEYTRNYLELERLRQSQKFNFEFDINENIDKNIIIPKMLIYTFAENAIKHGIRYLEGGGLLKLTITKSEKLYEIILKDNGIGRKKAKSIEIDNTGKGLGILDQILDLNYKLNGQKITYTTEDKTDAGGMATGTEVKIKVSIY